MLRTNARSRPVRRSGGGTTQRPVRTGHFWGRAVLALGLIAGLSVQGAFACGKSATIDGSDREWDRTGDFAKHMHKDGHESGSEMTDLDLRCDPATGKVHALVMAKNGYTLEDSADAWIKVDGMVVADKRSKDFAWIVKDGKRVGYECSFKYDFSKKHVIRAKAKVKHYEYWHAKYDYSDSGDYEHHFECQSSTPTPAPGSLNAVCGAAVVDGTVESDWNIASAPTTELKSSGGTATANLYVRYKDGTAYVLVLAKTGFTLYNYADYNKVTVGSTTVTPSSIPQGTAFKWVYNSSGAKVGYEASIPAASGQTLLAQAKATRNSQYYISTNLDQTLEANCGGSTGSTGNCGSAAVVDGNWAEWNLSKDFYARMWEAGDPTKPNPVVLSNLYFRWNNGVGYVLVLAADNYTLDRTNAWVKFYDISNKTVPFIQFAWIKNAAGKTIGYEASFAMTTAIQSAEVHAQVSGSGTGGNSCSGSTSSTGQKFKGTIALQIPACLAPTYGLGNRVWQEVNGVPGYQPDDGDLALGDVTVDVVGYDASGNLITESDGVTAKVFGTGTTDTGSANAAKKGCYLVGGLPAGNYAARILSANVPAGLKGVAIAGTQSEVFAGADEVTDDTGADGDQNGLQDDSTGDIRSKNLFTLDAGLIPLNEQSDASCGLGDLQDADVNSTADFALETKEPQVGIGDRIYIEINGTPGYQPYEDGMLDGAYDLPVPADTPVEVVDSATGQVATGANGAPATDVTDDEGCYLVEGLNPGTYFVRLPPSLFKPGGSLAGFTPAPSAELGVAWDDERDHNGRAELDGTQATGGVVTGTYTLAPGMSPIGNFNGTGTEVSGARACQAKVATLPDANVDRTADIALVEHLVAVGNKVWTDGKGGVPGTFDADIDTGVANIPVTLERLTLDAATGEPVLDDNGDYVIAETLFESTDENGFYLFDNLIPGTFRVRVPAEVFDADQNGALVGFVPSDNHEDGAAGTGDDNVDHNAQPLTDIAAYATDGVSSLPFTVWPGLAPIQEGSNGAGQLKTGNVGSDGSALADDSVDLTRDFAFTRSAADELPDPLMSIGSTVWIDANANGIQDGVEPGIKGVTLTLTGGDLTESKTATTDDNGNYLFPKLNAGAYTVTVRADQMTIVADALREYWGSHGLPSASVPVRAASTRLSVALEKADGDNNGAQADGMGGAVVDADVVLATDNEPVDGVEKATGADSTGYLQDGDASGTADKNGDMTQDVGFIHSCQVICDVVNRAGVVGGDGEVTQADLDKIMKLANKLVKVSPPGAAHSGDCGATGVVTTNDYVWCSALVQP